ncbi:MAG: 7-cyano-7-deazaguanine synthase QueC [Gammaproteobacteria bacterium]|nr:7-cyano-7-deazaguanine synthase QueC [Gammaproteobacteria bacterium]
MVSPKAIVLLSGGLDSTTCLAIAKSQGYDCYALSVDYGQRHIAELRAAERIAKQFQVRAHKTLSANLNSIGGSSLTDDNVDVKDYSPSTNIPNTYVPARNTVMLSLALAYAETVGAYDIFIGANVVDYSNYPDCRPAFLAAFEHLAQLSTKAGAEGQTFRIHAPLLHWSKSRIIQEGLLLGVDYGMTVSCYRLSSEGKACGKCDSCVLRKNGFEQLNSVDPTCY